MFNQLSSIVDRNFVVGFYIPALIFNLLTLIFNNLLPVTPGVFTSQTEDLSKATVFAAVTLVFALILQAFTHQIYRMLEGYWPWKLQYRLRGPQVTKSRRLIQKRDDLQSQIDKHRQQHGTVPARFQRKINGIARSLAERFPANSEDILPTSFGNVLRSFEDYSRHQYSFDAIHGWPSLSAVASKDFLDSVNGAQAFCDLWVNMVVVCTLLLIESVLVFHHAARLIVPLICLLAAWGSLQQAKEAAVAWGRWVKSAFDISLPDLLKKLGFQSPSKITDIRKIWEAYSQTIVYNDPDWWATVDNFRADPSKPPGSPVSGGG